jgi:excinuclease ABC subunit C
MRFPDQPGVYLFKDKAGRVIYVGKAKSLRERISSYFGRTEKSPKTEALLQAYEKVEFLTTPTELEALLLERKLIEKYAPHFNFALKDDKQYPYLKLTMNEKWPRLLVVRRKEKDGANYYGPYEGRSVKDTMRLLRRLFPLRSCKETPLKFRQQPCLQYHIKHCWGPCVGEVTAEEYHKLCQAVDALLKGDLEKTLGYLKDEMTAAAQNQHFEKAARIRNQIRNIERLLQKKPDWMPRAKTNEGEVGLYELRDILELARVPKRIEAFDASNLSSTNPVASLVVFLEGEPLKSDYRKFRIRTAKAPNDLAALNEAITRRYTGELKKTMKKPDLLVVDGGIGQVAAARSALKTAKLEVPLIGLAKKNEEIYLPGRVRPLKIDPERPAMKILRRLRDEAHRFAIKYQRSLRTL